MRFLLVLYQTSVCGAINDEFVFYEFAIVININ